MNMALSELSLLFAGRSRDYPPQMKAAILAVGTQILFQLSSDDATNMSAALSGGRQLAEVLKYLPHREIVVKSGRHRYSYVHVPEVCMPALNTCDLYERCRRRLAKPRADRKTTGMH